MSAPIDHFFLPLTHLSKVLRKGCLGAIPVMLLAGCASLSPEQCLQGDWRQIGFSDGVAGRSALRINDHSKACAEHGVRPNLDDYVTGREQGLRNYCQPENGFSIGRQGASHNAGDCPENMKPAFLDQYQRGYQIHLVETDLAQRRAHIDRNYRRMRHHDERIAAIRSELGRPDLPPARRTALLNDYNRLVDEKNFMGRENSLIQIEADRLQMHLYMRLQENGRWR